MTVTSQSGLAEISLPATGRTTGASSNCEAPPSVSPPTGYDLKLFKPRADEPPLVTAQRNVGDGSAAAPDAQKEALKRKLAQRLMAANSKLRICELPHQHIAHFEQISLEEARRKYRQLELRAPEGNGIQIVVRD